MSELIKREDLENWLRTECYGTDTDEDKEYVIERLRNELPTASPWHRVEDGLPEIGKIVLVYDEWHGLSICQLDKQYRWLRQGGGWFDAPYALYWMPIEPPKEE